MSERSVPEAMTILVVDDDPSLCKILKNALRKEGRRVITAPSGQQAVTRTSRQKVDVVLLDLKMPGLSGIETLQRLLELDPRLVVIVLTAYGSVESAREAMRLGAHDYLTKPLDLAFLEEVIADSLHQKQRSPVGKEQ
ncbi:MAG: response regulator [Candidatus Brocadiae bacterium]|nr:response regulator [Candidatus Brocadiia bacterium]